jgi:hypothetical protein
MSNNSITNKTSVSLLVGRGTYFRQLDPGATMDAPELVVVMVPDSPSTTICEALLGGDWEIRPHGRRIKIERQTYAVPTSAS